MLFLSWEVFLTTANSFGPRAYISLCRGYSYEVPFPLQLNNPTEFSVDLPDSCGGLAVALSCFGADGPGRSNESRSVGAAEPATFADFRPWRRERAGHQCRRHHSLPDAGRSGRFVYRFGCLVGMGKAYVGAAKSTDAGSFQS